MLLQIQYPLMIRRVYLAAPLFSEAERRFNLEVRNALARHAYDVYLPQERGEGTGCESIPNDRALFLEHLGALRTADAVVAICDGADTDSGTAWEMGYAHALGIPVIALRTDRRRAAGGRSLNLMLSQSSRVVTNVEEILTALEEIRG